LESEDYQLECGAVESGSQLLSTLSATTQQQKQEWSAFNAGSLKTSKAK
jgi:hypothetical protein